MIMALIASLIGYLRFRSRLKECLITDGSHNSKTEVFEYKGKLYNAARFVKLQADSLAGLKAKDLEKQLHEYESGFAASKTPDLDRVLIEAYKLALQNQ